MHMHDLVRRLLTYRPIWKNYRQISFSRDNSSLSERIATTVVALQSEVDASPRSESGTNLATERSEVKWVLTTT